MYFTYYKYLGDFMAQVTSGELQKEFGRYRTIAHREAVVITNHGREDLVLISAEEYRRLQELEKRAFHVSEMSDNDLLSLSEVEIPREASQYNDELK
ncbi:Phd/YefM family antitoxin [Oleiphilus messinensis]|uniref:Antitoxin n=2 Tax=Oleiphilus messinensis TaxID=141451 RepID=A0A1Y0I904_9GAMM|nr:Phd/YefM family antitoxin [Oleiphilus messinensis]